jgi:hypothetical protein
MNDSTSTYEKQLEYCWQLSLDGFCCEETGSVDELGWYGMLTFSATAHCDCPALNRAYGAILNQDSQGFKSVELYDNETQLNTAWYDIEQAYSEFYGDEDGEAEDEESDEPTEPEEDDITTTDHVRFYQNGKLVLTVEEDADYVTALQLYMESENFWPNCWFISDHGNAHLLEIGEF